MESTWDRDMEVEKQGSYSIFFWQRLIKPTEKMKFHLLLLG